MPLTITKEKYALTAAPLSSCRSAASLIIDYLIATLTNCQLLGRLAATRNVGGCVGGGRPATLRGDCGARWFLMEQPENQKEDNKAIKNRFYSCWALSNKKYAS